MVMTLEATITFLITDMKYFPTREFIGWCHRRNMRLGKKNYIGIAYEEVTSSWWNLLQPSDLWQYNHTEYCIGELAYDIPKGEAKESQRPWRLSVFGKEHVDELVSFANSLGEECKVSVEVKVTQKYPKTKTWEEYREDKDEYLELED